MLLTDLISSECPMRSLEVDAPKPACCELAKAEAERPVENTKQKGPKHPWLDAQLIRNLPVNIKKGKNTEPLCLYTNSME